MKLLAIFNLWSKRYLPAELFAIPTALIIGLIFFKVFDNLVISAIAATWGENLGYYGYIFFIDAKTDSMRGLSYKKSGLRYILKNISGMAVEFGPAEFIDSIMSRPIIIFLLAKYFQNLSAGIVMGKIAADAIFLILVFLGHSIRGKVFSK